jgi:hypothetical protein
VVPAVHAAADVGEVALVGARYGEAVRLPHRWSILHGTRISIVTNVG